MSQQISPIEHAWLESQQGLAAYIRSKVAQAEDAEDILSDVFAKLLKQADDNNLPDNIAAWLFLVTKNSLVDYYRSKKQFEQLPDDLTAEVDDRNAISQLSGCMVPMVQTLPEKYQQTLMLSEIEGKKYQDIADELDLSLSAVKTRVLRGRERLQKTLLQCCSIQHNKAGEVVDYEQKSTHTYDDCGC